MNEILYHVHDWEQHQHYKDRCPPWIKLHANILNSPKFTALTSKRRGLLMQIWVLASEQNGDVDINLTFLRFRLRASDIFERDIQVLISQGFLIPCKQTLADASKCYSETETETETETEGELNTNGQKPQELFAQFWEQYPKKKAKAEALEVFLKLKPSEELFTEMMDALSRQIRSPDWRKDGGQFIPYPQKWLRKKRWQDEIETEHGEDDWLNE